MTTDNERNFVGLLFEASVRSPFFTASSCVPNSSAHVFMGRNDLGCGYRGSAISGGGASDVRFVSPVPPFAALDLPSVLAPGE
ncbi:hypothetical protein ZIOFF_022697 [Zingiber officinale]|uniref:Uncharacterized protein n=1 Tax=Zingiber officinale TaxID=94328 RepID=A0A8J5HLL7_ZINOF|nr:hypothetical protein ZIOFF_022692 [Zingiber officinale]KAG6519205.1 hypothetical protein ZIOFF_022697 [Zingiber officinale]